MCHKIIFSYEGSDRQISFAYEKAKLPVLTKQGNTVLFPWGRRKHQPGKLPLGGWAILEDIYDGRWDRFFPHPVKLPIKAFYVRDIQDNVQSFELPTGKWIQGLLAKESKEERLYIVTLAPGEDNVYPFWPRVMI